MSDFRDQNLNLICQDRCVELTYKCIIECDPTDQSCITTCLRQDTACIQGKHLAANSPVAALWHTTGCLSHFSRQPIACRTLLNRYFQHVLVKVNVLMVVMVAITRFANAKRNAKMRRGIHVLTRTV